MSVHVGLSANGFFAVNLNFPKLLVNLIYLTGWRIPNVYTHSAGLVQTFARLGRYNHHGVLGQDIAQELSHRDRVA